MNTCFATNELLKNWKLGDYEKILIANNHNSIQEWNKLTLNELKCLGFKSGHAKRFIRNVSELIQKHGISNIELKSFDYNHICVVLLGETGVGKSTLMYSIEHYLNNSNFEDIDYTKKYSKHATQSQTQECEIKQLKLTQKPEHEQKHLTCLDFTLIDTPGIGDTSGVLKDRENLDKIMDCLIGNVTIDNVYNHINVFAFLLPRGTNRVTTKLKYILNEIKCNLPQSAQNHFIVILTRSGVEFWPHSLFFFCFRFSSFVFFWNVLNILARSITKK